MEINQAGDMIKFITLIVMFVLCSCSREADGQDEKIVEGRDANSESTEVCVRRSSSVANGEEISIFEFVITRSSGDSSKDIVRIDDTNKVDAQFFKNPDSKVGVWIGVELTD